MVTHLVAQILKRFLSKLNFFIQKSEEELLLRLLVCHDVLANITGDEPKLPDYSIDLKKVVAQETAASDELAVQWFLKTYLIDDDERTLIYRYHLLDRILTGPIGNLDFIRTTALCLNKSPQFVAIPYGSDFSSWDAPEKIAVVRQHKGVMLKTLGLLKNREDVREDRLLIDHAMFSSYSLMLSLDMFDALVEYHWNIRKGLPSQEDFLQLIHDTRETIERVRGVLTHA